MSISVQSMDLDVSHNREITQNTINEIADTLILIEQILYLAEKNGLNANQLLENSIEFKLERTIKRIKEGYYK